MDHIHNKKYMTIPGFESMSKQELFDMSAAHILKTRQQAHDGLSCTYASTGCGASPFLTEFNRTVATGSWHMLVIRGEVTRHEEEFVTQLQCAHDGAGPGVTFVANWKANMLRLAAHYGLSTAVLDNDDKVNGHG